MKNTFVLILVFIVTLFPLCFANNNLQAQSTRSDSLKRMAFSRDSLKRDSIADVAKTREKAKLDARRLKLNPEQRQIFNDNKQNANSDLFKPTVAFASNSYLLQDSIYVKTFRQAAYTRALAYRKRTAGHYIWIGGVVIGGLAIIGIFILAALLSSGALIGH